MKRKKKEMEREDSFLETVKTITYALIIAIFIRTFLFEPFKIPSASMYPTLYIGDYLFVSKYTYGYSKHSLPLSMPLFSGKVFADEPKRGDVVVFKLPKNESIDFIKRVIGLPGDKIRLAHGRLYINGEVVERKQVRDFIFRDGGGNPERYMQYVESLPEGYEHKIMELSDREPMDDYREVTIPQGYFFALGDNRDKSDDSRGVVGFVPMENIVGKARFLFFSHDSEGAWYKPWTWPKIVRWNRLFDTIE